MNGISIRTSTISGKFSKQYNAKLIWNNQPFGFDNGTHREGKHKDNTSYNVTHIITDIQFQWNIVSNVLSRVFGFLSLKNFHILFSNLCESTW
jgi:hypothetical protein